MYIISVLSFPEDVGVVVVVVFRVCVQNVSKPGIIPGHTGIPVYRMKYLDDEVMIIIL